MHNKIQEDTQSLAADVDSGPAASADHQALHDAYTRGYQAYINNGFDFKTGDDAVKGIDREVLKSLKTIVDTLDESSVKSLEDIRHKASINLWVNLGLVTTAVVVFFFIYMRVIQRGIIDPAKAVVSDLATMAEGDFTHPIVAHSNDEIGKIAASAATVQNDIGEIVKSINQSVMQLAAAADQMAMVTEQSNQAMMGQRNETEQVATAMNEMSATVHEVAQNTQLAAESAQHASTEVVVGQQPLKIPFTRLRC